MRILLTLTALPLALLGCTVGPDYVKPEIDVPDEWHTDLVGPMREGDAGLDNWWKVFEDPARGIKWATYKKVTEDGEVLFDGLLHKDVYGYNPPVPEGMPHYDTSKPRVGGWNDPGNTTGWADVE